MTGSGVGFEVLEHTADAGVLARGRTLAEAFAQTAVGMYSLMVALDQIRETEMCEVAIRGETAEDLLVAWLLELLFLTETQDLLFRRFDVEIDDGRVAARAYGEQIDPQRHELGAAIKGVTRHMLEVSSEDGGYRTRVLFDI